MVDSTPGDAELLDACAAGDERALAALYDRYGRLAYGVALHVVGDPALAEDAVREAFARVWRQAATSDRAGRRVSAWVVAVVHRQAVDVARRAPFPAALPDKSWASGPDDVKDALETLCDAEREVLELAYWGGMTQSRIAAALGVPVGTVKRRTVSALAKLRVALCETEAATA